MSVSSWWLIAGAALMALEAFGIPGIGLFFAGLAAIVVGGLVASDVVGAESYLIQLSLWFGMTCLMAVTLWKPMKRWRTNPNSKDKFSNMVGDTATVSGADLVVGAAGKVKWSGTTMSAEIAAGSTVSEIPVGTTVEIVEVRGNTLIVKPKLH